MPFCSKRRLILYSAELHNQEKKPIGEKDIQPGETLTIGSSNKNDIVSKFVWISRNHGTINYLPNKKMYYEDHSRLGTWLLRKGKHTPIKKERVRIFKGDQLQIILFAENKVTKMAA